MVKRMLGMVLGLLCSYNWAMEQDQESTIVEKQLRAAYQYIDEHNDQYCLLEAIVKKDIPEINKIITTCPEQARPYLLNRSIEIFCLFDEPRSKDNYPTLYAFYEQNKRKFNEISILPLALAAAVGDIAVAQTLFNYNIPLTINLGRDDSPIKMAAKCSPACIPLLKEKGVSQVFINDALFTAIIDGDIESVKALLQAGASLKTKARMLHLTPLHVACNNGKYEVVKLFLDNGAFVDETDPDGLTPLHWSCLNMKGHIANLLLEYGANVFAKTESGNTPIECISMSFGVLDAVNLLKQGAPYPTTKEHEELLDKGQDLELFCSTPFYKSYWKALIKDDTQGALAAIEQARGNDFNTATMNKLTALHLAVIRGNRDVVNALIHRPNKRLNGFVSKIPVISSYVQHPVNINCRDEKGRTPLIWAARLGYTQIYKDLVRVGAKSSIQDATGRIALNYAVDYRNIDTLEEMIVDGTLSPKK